MDCPNCDKDLVKMTLEKDEQGGYTKKVYTCLTCGHRWTKTLTREEIDEQR